MIETKFKQTELGPIPEDWQAHTIEDLIIAMNDGPFGTKLKQEHYTSKREARIIQLGNIGEDGWIDSNVKYTTFEYAKHLSNHIANPGDVLIAKMMPAGRAIICPDHEACFVQGSDAIKVKFNDSINARYFVYGTKSREYLRIIEENTQGSTRQRIAITKYKALPFILPPKEEQIKIADALSDIDGLIREINVLIEKKVAVMQGSIQELLSARHRLPGFSIPWKHIILGDTVNIYRGGSPRPIENFITTNPNGLNWIKIGDVRPKDKYIVQTAEKIIPEGLSSTREVHVGDFILSNSMSFGRPYILKIDGCIHDGWLAITNYENTFDKDYLYYLLGSDSVYKQYLSLAAGSGVLNLNKKLVAAVELDIPDIEEQLAIAAILSDMDAEITELETKRDKYAAIRQGMMQQLLTGKIRLI